MPSKARMRFCISAQRTEQQGHDHTCRYVRAVRRRGGAEGEGGGGCTGHGLEMASWPFETLFWGHRLPWFLSALIAGDPNTPEPNNK
jgi:hypothetical protein